MRQQSIFFLLLFYRTTGRALDDGTCKGKCDKVQKLVVTCCQPNKNDFFCCFPMTSSPELLRFGQVLLFAELLARRRHCLVWHSNLGLDEEDHPHKGDCYFPALLAGTGCYGNAVV